MNPFLKNYPNALSYNRVFERVFCDEEIVKEFIEQLTGKKIRSISNLQCEKSVSPELDSKSVRFNIYFEGDDSLYDIEMQKTSEPYLTRRIRMYQSVLDRDALQEGTSYHRVKNTVIIFICDFDPVGENLPIYEKVSSYKGLPNVEYEDGSKVYILNGMYTGDYQLPDGILELYQRICGSEYTHSSSLCKLIDSRLDNVLSDYQVQNALIRERMREDNARLVLEEAQFQIKEAQSQIKEAQSIREEAQSQIKEAQSIREEAQSIREEAESKIQEAQAMQEQAQVMREQNDTLICSLLEFLSVEEVSKRLNLAISYVQQLSDRYNTKSKRYVNPLKFD